MRTMRAQTKMPQQPQLECRIVLTFRRDGQVGMGMFDPLNDRYEPLGVHPRHAIDKAVAGLKESILRAGHRLTFCERSQ